MIPKIKIHLKESTYKVDKTGIPFYDAARLIGVAHLFFGSASAEIEDKGAYWEVRGIDVRRDEEQIEWVVGRLSRTLSNEERKLFKRNKFWWEMSIYFSQKVSEIVGGKIFSIQKCNGKYKIKVQKNNRVICDLEVKKRKSNELDKLGYPKSVKTKIHRYLKVLRGEIKSLPLKAEYDASLQIGTRGADPLIDYKRLAPRSTEVKEKKFFAPFQEVAAATLGRGFAASVISRTKRRREEMYILPIFSSHVVLSGFLDYEWVHRHSAGGFVASVLAAISILLDLTLKKIPVTDFTYTKEVKSGNQSVFSESGYLGFEKLCTLWWKAVEENYEDKIRTLNQIRSYLYETRNVDQRKDSQNFQLARCLANFAVNLDVDSLCMIERLKARILASQQNIYPALNLFKSPKDIKEVKKMVDVELNLGLPDIPEDVSKALAKALEFDEKGWMNQFTRLENATDFSQFISYIEHIISRGYYRELQEKGQADIRRAMNRARELASTLRELHNTLGEEKKFRAWKSIFLINVLSKMKFKAEGGE